MTEGASREITVVRIVDAPRELVFRAWTESDHLAKWWGPEGFWVPEVESDATKGGAFRIVMRGPDDVDHALRRTYSDFDPPERLVAESTVLGPADTPLLEAVTTITLVDRDGRTELTVHERASALTPEADMMLGGMEVGMVQSLRRLEAALAGVLDRQIVLLRMYEASPATVFEAWTTRSAVEKWWGPNGFTITVAEMDVRPGGTWRFTMHGPDGVDYPNLITYEDVSAPEQLVFRHEGAPDDPAFRSTVTFDDFGGMTVLTMRNVFATTEERDLVVEKYGAIEGGNQTLDRLGEYLTSK